MKITHYQAKRLADELGVLHSVDLAELRLGTEVELEEHEGSFLKFVPYIIHIGLAAQIAIDHLSEDPHYYSHNYQKSSRNREAARKMRRRQCTTH